MGRSDSRSSLSPRFVAFAWRYHRVRRGWLPAIATRDRGHREVDDPVSEPEIAVETIGSPRFPGNPHGHWPCSATPAGPSMCCGFPCRMPGAAPVSDKNEGSRNDLSRLNRTAFDLAVYASQCGLLHPTQDSLPAADPALPGGIGHPQGSNERFQALGCPPLPSFSWRNVSSI